MSEALEKLLLDLEPVKERLLMFQTLHEVTLSCYLRSDFGQMGFVLSPKAIQILAKINLEIEFHILSFGGVEN